MSLLESREWCYIKAINWGSHNVGWKGISVCSHFPTNVQYKHCGTLNHHSGKCTPTLGISIMEFCHVIKIIPAESNPDVELLTQQTFCCRPSSLCEQCQWEPNAVLFLFLVLVHCWEPNAVLILLRTQCCFDFVLGLSPMMRTQCCFVFDLGLSPMMRTQCCFHFVLVFSPIMRTQCCFDFVLVF